MKCKDFHALLHDFFIGDLSPEKKPDIDHHVEECQKCRELLEVAYELTCKEFVEFLREYLEDELAPDRKSVFERHLAICPECTAYLETYRQTVKMGREAFDEAAEESVKEMPDGLVQSILSSMKKR